MEIPDAPITHHWLDSTHITFGVVSAGVVLGDAKLEGSIFNGHEPDEDRYDIETGALDSYSGRVSYNIGENWSVQSSYGYLDSPEQLHPDINTKRVTVSATHNLPLDDGNLATTLAWGRNNNDGSEALDAFLLESSLALNSHHTIFARLENVEKDELFPEEEPQHGEVFRVSKLSAGYIYDIFDYSHIRFGVGGEGSISLIPRSIEPAYGSDPLSFFIFLRAKII